MAAISTSAAAELRPQQRVVLAAAELFSRQGYAQTSVRQIAQRARASLDTVYADGGKPEIFLRAMELLLRGAEDPTPLLQAPEMETVWEAPTLREVVSGLVDATVAANVRAAEIWPAFVEAAASDATLQAAMVAKNDAMRAEGRRAVAFIQRRGLGLPDIDVNVVADLIWAEAHPQRYLLLVDHAGWSVEKFTRYLTDRIMQLLTEPRHVVHGAGPDHADGPSNVTPSENDIR